MLEFGRCGRGKKVERFLKNLAAALGSCIAEGVEVLDTAIAALI